MIIALLAIVLAAGLAGGAAVFLLALVLRATGFVAARCPRCGTSIPLIRKPANSHQTTLGRDNLFRMWRRTGQTRPDYAGPIARCCWVGTPP